MKPNTKKNLKCNLLLLLTATIWGFAFVAQRVGADYLGAFSFNGIRFMMGALSLVPVILLFDRSSLRGERGKNTALAALFGGIVLFIASTLQQWGIEMTGSAGKAGFITGLYTVLVPVAGFILWKKRTSVLTWCGVVCAVIGLYLISMTGAEKPGLGDLVLILGSLFWTAHILIIDRFTAKDIHALWFASGQFALCGALNLICALFFEEITRQAVSAAGIPLLYGGLMSVGVAYTLQIIGQRDADPTAASIILSLESMFSAVGGALILNERMTVGGYVGCVLMLSGIVLSQIPTKDKKAPKTEERPEKQP